MLCDFSLVEFVGVTLDDSDGILRTFAQAGAKSVAKVVRREHGLAVNHLDGAFGA